MDKSSSQQEFLFDNNEKYKFKDFVIVWSPTENRKIIINQAFSIWYSEKSLPKKRILDSFYVECNNFKR